MDDDSRSTLDRRRFLTVLGVSAGGGALALSGCTTDRVQKLVPYLVQSEDQVPASPPGTRAPAPSAPAGAGCTCGPARGGR